MASGSVRPAKEVVDKLKEEALPFVQMDTFMKRPPHSTDLTGIQKSLSQNAENRLT